MGNPVAVLISDVHYSLSTLELADTAFRMAIDKAAELQVPLVDCGDLTNDKAVIRAEVANALIRTMQYAQSKGVRVALLIGNHSLVNEKAKEHALEFLKPYADVIQSPVYDRQLDSVLIPYFSSSEELLRVLSDITPKGSRIIMHQGVQTANMGHYALDNSSLPREVFSDFRVISGHYHCRQDIKCGPPRKGAVGLFSYVGNPYSLTYGEAADGPKGFQVLYDDGHLEFVPTNLRKHAVIDWTWGDLVPQPEYNPEDLIWVKVSGPASQISKVTKSGYRLMFELPHNNFKLDLSPTKSDKLETAQKKMPPCELLDTVIDASSETAAEKKTLKSLWREVLNAPT